MTEIEELRDILANAHAISVDCDDTDRHYIVDITNNPVLYEVPTSYRVIVDFNKMAEAVYNAGYRKYAPVDTTFKGDVRMSASHVRDEISMMKEITKRNVEIAKGMDKQMEYLLRGADLLCERIGGTDE